MALLKKTPVLIAWRFFDSRCPIFLGDGLLRRAKGVGLLILAFLMGQNFFVEASGEPADDEADEDSGEKRNEHAKAAVQVRGDNERDQGGEEGTESNGELALELADGGVVRGVENRKDAM